MSHVSEFEAEERLEAQFVTPVQNKKARSVREFLATKFATPGGVKNYSAVATPGRHRIDLEPDLVALVEGENDAIELNEMVNKTWSLHQVSPLFGYYDKLNGEIERYLKQVLEADDTIVNPGDKITVEVTMLKCLRAHRHEEYPLKIKVKRRVLTDNVSVLFTGYFMSVNAQEVKLETKRVAVWPLFISNGDDSIRASIVGFFEKQFDCVISSMGLNEMDLKWMSTLWSGFALNVDGDKKNTAKDMVKFRFKTTNATLTHIDLKFPGKEFRVVWKNFTDGKGSDMAVEDVDEFHEILAKTVEKNMGINLRELRLGNISLPILSAAEAGTLRINRPDKIKTIFGFLTSVSQENGLLSAAPRLGVPLEFSTY